MSPGLNERIVAVVAQTFGVPPTQIHTETRRGDFEAWDSIGHINLIEALRTEFDIEIPPEQALDMESVADVQRIVAEAATSRRPATP